MDLLTSIKELTESPSPGELTQPLPGWAHIFMQERLSNLGSFCLCEDEPSEEGYLIRFVSQGFVNLFDFKPSECVGERCFNVFARNKILQYRDDLAKISCMEIPLVEDSIRSNYEYAIEESIASSHRPGFILCINRKKNGTFLVCSVVLLKIESPSFGWTFIVKLQTDITMCVPIVRLLLACRPGGDYAELRKEQEAVMRARLSGQGLESLSVVQYFQEKMHDVWCGLLGSMHPVRLEVDTSVARSSHEKTGHLIESVAGFSASITDVYYSEDGDHRKPDSKVSSYNVEKEQKEERSLATEPSTGDETQSDTDSQAASVNKLSDFTDFLDARFLRGYSD